MADRHQGLARLILEVTDQFGQRPLNPVEPGHPQPAGIDRWAEQESN